MKEGEGEGSEGKVKEKMAREGEGACPRTFEAQNNQLEEMP